MAAQMSEYSTHSHLITGSVSPDAMPVVRKITVADIKDALREGWDDFSAFPTHAIFLVVIYPVVGLMIGRAVLGSDILPLLFPLMAGFALLGPFAALGLYELSRRREQGLDVSLPKILEARH